MNSMAPCRYIYIVRRCERTYVPLVPGAPAPRANVEPAQLRDGWFKGHLEPHLILLQVTRWSVRPTFSLILLQVTR